MHYQMPGAQVQMEGKIELVGSTFEFHGKVRTEATASQMTTGWKSLLLSPFDKLLKKNGAGLELPIKVTGTRSTYDLRLDFPHDTHAPAGLTSPREMSGVRGGAWCGASVGETTERRSASVNLVEVFSW